MSAPLYFRATPSPGFPCDYEELCHTLAHHREQMQDNGETVRTLYRAVPDRSTHHFFCRALGEVGTTEDGGCSTACAHYAPRNGRSGRCRYHTHCYTADHQQVKVLHMPAPDPDSALRIMLRQQGFHEVREVPGRGLCGIKAFLFTVGLCYGLDREGFAGRYCYPREQTAHALAALVAWDGTSHPAGPWIKHKAPGIDESNPTRTATP